MVGDRILFSDGPWGRGVERSESSHINLVFCFVSFVFC